MNAHILQFIADLQLRNYSLDSMEIYLQCLNRFNSFSAEIKVEEVTEVTPELLEQYRLYLFEKDYAVNTILIHLKALRNFFSYLEQKAVVFFNPAANLKNPKKPQPLPKVPTEQEINSFLLQPDVSTVFGLRNRAILELLYSTGIRRRELLQLTIHCPNFINRSLRIKGKGNRERIVPVGKEALHWLKEYLNETRPELFEGLRRQKKFQFGVGEIPVLWLSHRNPALSLYALNEIFRKYRDIEGINTRITPHSLRRACATHMLKNGANPEIIRQLLGHSDLQSLAHYLRLDIKDLSETHSKTNPGR